MYTDLTEPNPSGNPYGPCPHQKLAGIGVGEINSGESSTVKYGKTYWIPFKFWFCRNPGLYLPLIALQYHEVKLKIELWQAEQCSQNNMKLKFKGKPDLWVNYMYLDTDERRRFAQVSHEYLIEQIQIKRSNFHQCENNSIKLNFNHPVKELIWTNSQGGAGAINSTSLVPIISHVDQTFQLKLNGHDRMAMRPFEYYSRVQVWQHHTGFGGLVSSAASVDGVNSANDSICVYSFALKPEEHQPSGTCNFSRIDNAQLSSSHVLESSDGDSNVVYAVNYNVLRIMSGMGGLAYSN
jgi:hypothetical protein